MNDKIIEFSAPQIILDDLEIRPEPSKKTIPEWYKDLPLGTIEDKNIKNCKPFLDSLLAGYTFKSPIDYNVHFNDIDPQTGKKNTWVIVNHNNQRFAANINKDQEFEIHPKKQLGGDRCPFIQTNKFYNVYKIYNPWHIKVPKGYSILFLPPINKPDPRFEIVSGIVDAGYIQNINFPIIFKQEGEWLLKKGTPLLTIFPFKTENWKATFKEVDTKEANSFTFKFASYLINFYKDKIRVNKKWR